VTGYTPIYNLPYVEASDLVANYPTVSEELAENVETAIAGSGGMTLIDEETFSAVSSVSFNNVFSSTYVNYRIIAYATQSVVDNWHLRLRASGTDASGANYTFYQFRGSGGATVTSPNVNQTWHQMDPVGGVGPKTFDLLLFRPNLAATTLTQIVCGNLSTAGVGLFSGVHSLTTAYDGFTVHAATGTITGTIKVYGLKGA
jgi:hypothetical protein